MPPKNTDSYGLYIIGPDGSYARMCDIQEFPIGDPPGDIENTADIPSIDISPVVISFVAQATLKRSDVCRLFGARNDREVRLMLRYAERQRRMRVKHHMKKLPLTILAARRQMCQKKNR